MKYAWAFMIPSDENVFPFLYSSYKKALFQFNDECDFVKKNGSVVNIVKTTYGIAASWIENEGTRNEVQRTMEVRKIEIM